MSTITHMTKLLPIIGDKSFDLARKLIINNVGKLRNAKNSLSAVVSDKR